MSDSESTSSENHNELENSNESENLSEPENLCEPLEFPAEGLPDVIDTNEKLIEVCKKLDLGSGPIAVDAERASSFRYTARAYLVQLRRQNAGTFLIDPIAITDFSHLSKTMSKVEWILHAATQDLACLSDLGLKPTKLFDTEHAGRLLGRPRVGLQALLESEMNISLAKEHSAADWSTRPLPEPWLIYAALDVEKLIELREILLEDLIAKDRLHWAEQDFANIVNWQPPKPLAEPWRKTSGIHKVRQPRQLAVIRELWNERDRFAKERDKSVSKVLSDAAIIDISILELKSARDVYMLESLRNRSHKANADLWWKIRQNAMALKENELPKLSSGLNSIPPTKSWEEKNPEAFIRFSKVRPAVLEMAENLAIAPEILISPESIRQLCWSGFENISDETQLSDWLLGQGARPWQIQLICADLYKLLFARN
jgi:ribonuclease D